MPAELDFDDICKLVGRLHLENFRLLKELPLLTAEIDRLRKQVEALSPSAPTVAVVEKAVEAA